MLNYYKKSILILTVAAVMLPLNVFSLNQSNSSELKFSEARVDIAKLEIDKIIESKNKVKKILAIATIGTTTTLAIYWFLNRDKFYLSSEDFETFKAFIASKRNSGVQTDSNIEPKENNKKSWGSWFRSVPRSFCNFGKDLCPIAFSGFKHMLAMGVASTAFENLGILGYLEKMLVTPDFMWLIKNRTVLGIELIDEQSFYTPEGNAETIKRSISLDSSNLESATFYNSQVKSKFISDISNSSSPELLTKLAIKDIESLCGYIKYKIEKAKLNSDFLKETSIVGAQYIYDSLKFIANTLGDLLDNFENNAESYNALSEELAKLIVSFIKIENRLS